MKRRWALLLAALALLVQGPAWAMAWVGCQPTAAPTASQVDGLLQLSALVQEELEHSGAPVALISRSGLQLERLGHLHSHAGFALPMPSGPWQVRQLYMDCAASQPGLFDEGLPGFVMGASATEQVRVAIVFVPQARVLHAQSLALQVSDAARAVSLLGARYSANAHAWSTVHQNCNQWVAEMLGLAISRRVDSDGIASEFVPAPLGATDARTQAQASLRAMQAKPSVITWPTLLPGWLIGALPYLSLDDHPVQDLRRRQFQVWMPQSLEALIQSLEPQSQRTEFCMVGRRIVVHRGWQGLSRDCAARDGDRVLMLV